MTAFCGILDPADGSFQFANAGHPYPRWWRASRRVVETVRHAAGPPLGTDCHASYQLRGISIEPGDVLVLHSEGLTVALNQKAQVSVPKHLDDALGEAAPQGAEAVKSALLARLDDVLPSRACPDEITFMVIERQRDASSLVSGWCP